MARARRKRWSEILASEEKREESAAELEKMASDIERGNPSNDRHLARAAVDLREKAQRLRAK